MGLHGTAGQQNCREHVVFMHLAVFFFFTYIYIYVFFFLPGVDTLLSCIPWLLDDKPSHLKLVQTIVSVRIVYSECAYSMRHSGQTVACFTLFCFYIHYPAQCVMLSLCPCSSHRYDESLEPALRSVTLLGQQRV